MDNISLCLDLGNSRCKFIVYRGQEELVAWTGGAQELTEQLEKALESHHPSRSILCSVSGPIAGIEELLTRHSQLLRLDHLTALPFTNGYEKPATLGMDRVALAAGAVRQFPGQHVLAISAGTCITFNFINKEQTFLGGSISPGLRMRLQALHEFTGGLPLEAFDPLFPLVGYNTRQSILSGCLGGAVAETEGLILNYQEKWQDLAVVLTGGDASFFERHLKTRIFAVPGLLFRGLLSILDFNHPPSS